MQVCIWIWTCSISQNKKGKKREEFLHSLLFVSSNQFGKSLKKEKTESMNLISACCFSVVDTTSTQMIGSAPGSHGCACHCGSVIAGWSSDCVHRHACHWLALLLLWPQSGSPLPDPSPLSLAECCPSAACNTGWGWSVRAGESPGLSHSPPPPHCPDYSIAQGSQAPVWLE